MRARLALLFAAILLCALWLAGITPVDVVSAVFWPAVILLILLVVSAQHRAVPGIKIRTMLISGMMVVPVLAVVFVALFEFLEDILPFLPNQTQALLSSVLVEVFLMVPVIVLLRYVSRGRWITFTGPLDTALLGAGCGAGFEIVENLAGRVPWQATPEWFLQSAYILWAGHAVVTAFAGLMLGFGLYFRNRTTAWPVLPALGLIWAGALHYATLDYNVSRDAFLSLLLDGRLFLLTFVIAFAISLYLAGRTLRWYTDRDTDAGTDVHFLSILSSPKKAPGGLSGPVTAFEQFRRLRQVNAYGFWKYDQGAVQKDAESFILLLFLQSQMKILQKGVPKTR